MPWQFNPIMCAVVRLMYRSEVALVTAPRGAAFGALGRRAIKRELDRYPEWEVRAPAKVTPLSPVVPEVPEPRSHGFASARASTGRMPTRRMLSTARWENGFLLAVLRVELMPQIQSGAGTNSFSLVSRSGAPHRLPPAFVSRHACRT